MNTHAAYAGIVQALQFVIADVGRHDPRRRAPSPKLSDGRERAAVVEAVARRLHDDCARQTQPALQLPIMPMQVPAAA